MLDIHALERDGPRAKPSDVPLYPDHLLPELQGALAALADLEVQFEIARDSLEEWSGPEDEKRRHCVELEQAHRKAREAHLRGLARVQSGSCR